MSSRNISWYCECQGEIGSVVLECNENQEIQKAPTLCVSVVYFSCWVLGFWQQLCALEMTVFSEEEVILLGTTGQLSEFWESCAASLQVMVSRILQGHVEIRDRLYSPKGDEDCVLMGTFASCPGTESQGLVGILRSCGGFHQVVHNIRSSPSIKT